MSKRDRPAPAWEEEESPAAETARVLMLLAQAQQRELMMQQRLHHGHGAPLLFPASSTRGGNGGRVFECKTCSRQFPTFQALGGHRASHKRPRLLQHQQADGHHVVELCLGPRPPLLPPQQQQQRPAKPRVHECPVCGLEFAVGQALGGHMRRHRAEADGTEAPTTKLLPASERSCDGAGGICLDLNLTPSENCAKCRNVLVRGTPAGQGVGLHKTLAMLDCSM